MTSSRLHPHGQPSPELIDRAEYGLKTFLARWEDSPRDSRGSTGGDVSTETEE
ncbi:hypothetical protein HYE82_05350 [Streptomyces sp. BR123]|uniref:hypothetical protein n=1 Tax=Streptomyces sp. BR123 TaxID=2749828 RepID=UPI0015C41223|nr:hypothetical protein [Streptomyces sp. BR123]NXY93830.1 hypothetical protein [Streptomyces sp. BR123]